MTGRAAGAGLLGRWADSAALSVSDGAGSAVGLRCPFPQLYHTTNPTKRMTNHTATPHKELNLIIRNSI